MGASRRHAFDLAVLLLFALVVGPPLAWAAGAVLKALGASVLQGHAPWDARSLTLLGRSALIGVGRAAAAPYLRLALAAAALLVGLLAAADFGVPATFSLPVYTVDLQAEFAASRDYAHAWALVTPYFLAVVPLILIERLLLQATPLAG